MFEDQWKYSRTAATYATDRKKICCLGLLLIISDHFKK